MSLHGGIGRRRHAPSRQNKPRIPSVQRLRALHRVERDHALGHGPESLPLVPHKQALRQGLKGKQAGWSQIRRPLGGCGHTP